MLAVEDYIHSLEWAQGLGGLRALIARADANAAAVDAWVEATPWIEHLVADPAIRTNTGVCLKFSESAVRGLDEDGHNALVGSAEHTSELQPLMRISYPVFCLQQKKQEYASSMPDTP